MLKIFIYYEEQDKWVEEHSYLLSHDFAAFIDEDAQIIYLWNGPQSTRERLKKGTKALHEIINNYAENRFQVINLQKKIPSDLKSRLEKILKITKKEEEVVDYHYSHFFTIRLHSIFSIICLLLPIIALIILNSSLYWDSIGNNYIVYANDYNNWLSFTFMSLLASLIFFIPQLIMAVYEYDISIIVFSSTSIIICISLLLYLQQGIFLFQFQEQSTQSLFYIAKIDLYIFLLLVSLVILLFEIPNIIKTINFLMKYKKFIIFRL